MGGELRKFERLAADKVVGGGDLPKSNCPADISSSWVANRLIGALREDARSVLAGVCITALFAQNWQKLCPSATVVTPLVDGQELPTPKPIRLDPDLVTARLGVDVPVGYIRQTLVQLGFRVQDRSDGSLMVQVPSWRATKDVSIVEDLIEENRPACWLFQYSAAAS